MKLRAYLELERGRSASLARKLGVKPVNVSRWSSGAHPVPTHRCVQIERLTGGEVRRQDLRDDFADHWPELAQPADAPAQQAA